MNYANLEKEISDYKTFSVQEEQTLNKFSQFFRTISKQGVIFTEKVKSALEELSTEISKETRNTSHNISFSRFCLDFKTYLDNIKTIYSSMEKNISDKIIEFISENKTNFEENNNKLHDMLIKLAENKAKIEKYKHSYFDASKVMFDQEKKIKEKNKSKESVNKYENISEGQKQIYKEELNKFNDILDEEEEQYKSIVENYSKCYQEKINCLINYMILFKNCIKSYLEKYKEMLTNVERSIPIINVRTDVEYFRQDMNYTNENKRRFIKEDFLDYELLKKSIEQNEEEDDEDNDGNKIYFENNSISMKNVIAKYNITYEKSLKIVNLGKDFDYDEDEDEGFSEENKKLNSYIKELLTSEKELPKDKYVFLLRHINDTDITNFTDILMTHYRGNKFVKMKNLENLKLFSSILNIIINCSYNNKDIFYICFIALFISEKTIFFSKKNNSKRYYLCKLLPKKTTNTIFSSNNFWTELINVNIAMLADILTRKEVEKRDKLKEQNKNSGMLNKVKNIFANKKDLENQKIENEILYNQIYNEKLPNYCVKILNDYLRHFSNFDFEPKKGSEIIVDMSIKYKFDQSYVTYFIAELNSNMCANLNQKKMGEEEYINEINEDNDNLNDSIFTVEDDDNVRVDYELLYKKKLDKKISKHITNAKLRIIIHCIKYLELEELPNLLAANKLYNKTLTKFIYKNLLIRFGKDLDISKHIEVWKMVLNYTQTTVKYNYEEIKQKIEVNPNQEQYKVIELDIRRTNFDTDNNLNQRKIGNILKSISHIIPKLNYCQGMNYIAAFFLNITNNNEEVSFYLFLSMLLQTEYGKLFEKDLEKLKKYFYVFERIICICLPELYVHLRETHIDVSYFLSPWLITLFTDNYKYIKDRNNPIILLKIFDLFFFSGWKSIIKIGIILLKTYESKLMNLGQEDLLKYLISGICKNNFFQNEYFDKLVQTLENFKIEGFLINSVENEYELRQYLPKVGGKNIFEMT